MRQCYFCSQNLIDIDYKLIKGKNINIAELAGGCVCCSLTGEFELATKELIKKYLGAFAENDDDLGRTQLCKHAIDTGDARPIKQRSRPLAFANREYVKAKSIVCLRRE